MNSSSTRRSAALILSVALLLAVAGGLRLAAADFGFPLLVHTGERAFVRSALEIATSESARPNSFQTPSLQLYVQALAFRWSGASASAAGTAPFRIGRFLTATMGTATCLIVFAIALRLWGLAAGLAAGLSSSLALLHVEPSFVATTDAPAALWVVLALAFSLRGLETGSLRDPVLSGVFAGLALGTSYFAFPAALLPLTAAGLEGGERRGIRAIGSLCATGVAFIVSTPYAVIEPQRFLAGLGTEFTRFAELGHPGSDAATSYPFYAASLTDGYGALALALSLTGLALLVRTEPRRALLLAVYPVSLLLAIGALRVHFVRNLTTLIPFLALYTGFTLAFTLRALRRVQGPIALRAPLGFGLVTVLTASLALQGIDSLERVRELRLPDTRWIALRWLEERLPQDAVVAREAYTPPLERGGSFDVTRAGLPGLVTDRVYRGWEGFDYLIASSASFARYFEDADRYPVQVERYSELFERFRLVREFRPSERATGPVLRLYMTPRPQVRAESQVDAGTALATAGKLAQAREQFESASGTCPFCADPLVQLGLLAAREGKAAAALSFFQRAVEADPNDSIALRLLERARPSPAPGPGIEARAPVRAAESG